MLIGFAIEQVGNFFFRPLIHNFVCRKFTFGIHAHIQRARFAKRKPARALIKLHRGNPQVGQDPVPLGTPNPSTTPAILENAHFTRVTRSFHGFKFSRANSKARSSWSRLINLPETNLCAIAAEWPPAPSVAST